MRGSTVIVFLKFKCILYTEIALNNISQTVCELETWTLNIVVMHSLAYTS